MITFEKIGSVPTYLIENLGNDLLNNFYIQVSQILIEEKEKIMKQFSDLLKANDSSLIDRGIKPEPIDYHLHVNDLFSKYKKALLKALEEIRPEEIDKLNKRNQLEKSNVKSIV